VGDTGVDPKDKGSFPGERVGQIDFDWRPAVAVRCDGRSVDQDRGLMEHAFHDQHDVATQPIVRDLDQPPVAPDSGGVAKARKLSLPDSRRADLMALSGQTRGRAFERELPKAVETERG